jgi:phenylalanine-4-hydroxylase
MGKAGKYIAHEADASGVVRYTEEEHRTWAELYARQELAIRGKACDEFLHGLTLLNLPRDHVPQLRDVSRALCSETGWEIAPVPGLIPFDDFFQLLADRRFPAANFIRRHDELDYLQEPDIFHEIFGHTPMLTHPYFAEFTHTYGKLGLAASEEDRVFLARMYWFTVEFGLIQPPGEEPRFDDALNGIGGGSERPAMDGRARLSDENRSRAKDCSRPVKIYGGGILSSIGETEYAVGKQPLRKRFNILDALRTPYRIDIMQPLYYVIEDLRELYELTRGDLMAQLVEAKRLGLHAPQFPPQAPASHPPAAKAPGAG